MSKRMSDDDLARAERHLATVPFLRSKDWQWIHLLFSEIARLRKMEVAVRSLIEGLKAESER